MNVVYFDVHISNPMSIFGGRNQKPSIIRKNEEFSELSMVSEL